MPDEALKGPVFIAAGEDGFRMFSHDGTAWINRQSGKEGDLLNSIAVGNGRALIVGRSGGIDVLFSTEDALAWKNAKHEAQYAKYIQGLTWFNKRFLAFGSGETVFVMTSEDGVAWGEPKTVPGQKNKIGTYPVLRRFAIGENILVAVGDYGRKSVSKDGLDWKDTPDVKAVDTLIDIAYGNGVFVGGGLHGLRMRSTDGLAWTDRVVGEEGEHINSMFWDGKKFVGVGQGATYVSPDGQKWERVPNKNAPTVAAFGNGIYAGSLWPGRLLRSTDGITWNEVAKVPQHIEMLSFGILGKG